MCLDCYCGSYLKEAKYLPRTGYFHAARGFTLLTPQACSGGGGHVRLEEPVVRRVEC